MSGPLCPPGGVFTEELDSCDLRLAICAESSSLSSANCSCSVIAYLIDACCSACLSFDSSWESYAADNNCNGLPQQFPSPLPTDLFTAPDGRTTPIPPWALAMASATPTPTVFNFAAAKAFAVVASEEVTQAASSTSSSASARSSAANSSLSAAGPFGITVGQPTLGTLLPSVAGSGGNVPPTQTGSAPSPLKKTPPTGAIIGIVIANLRDHVTTSVAQKTPTPTATRCGRVYNRYPRAYSLPLLCHLYRRTQQCNRTFRPKKHQ
ncbi:hypothetical protein FB451DRAFT_107219 [Mycena latifolia]|nr:hypothetical protein FB451DRAFT_107219 [Mycena latifolia]